MSTNTNLKYAYPSLNDYVMILQNLKIIKISKISIFSRGTKCRVEANNNREAVVVCARHVVELPSKVCALVCIHTHTLISF